MPVTVYEPVISAAVLTPNPATINAGVTASVTITDAAKTLYERYQYCGVARCGGGF